MGCYGIGASRIVAAAIEQNHDEKGIIWPNSLSPYEVVIVEANPKSKDDIKAKCNEIYNQLKENGVDVLWEDTDKRPGVKFADMELIGIPIMIIIGDKAMENNQLELKIRKDEKPMMVSHEDLLNTLKELN
jgi:prolyl-tRNA synthetase